jgi:hypothetical protein
MPSFLTGPERQNELGFLRRRKVVPADPRKPLSRDSPFAKSKPFVITEQAGVVVDKMTPIGKTTTGWLTLTNPKFDKM